MDTNTFDPHQFYAAHGQISHPGDHVSFLEGFPENLPDLVKTIQGLMLHLHWAPRYGITLNRIRENEANLRLMKDRIPKILELSKASPIQERNPSQKSIGTCRDFSLMLTSLFRHRGIPARARAGFGTYFVENFYEDHWICEYWDSKQERWVKVDPQLDELQIEALAIDFNPLDIPEGKFVTGGQAWRLCRSKQADPKQFGIFKMRGLDFVKGDMIRDFLALNKIEVLPWDNFKLIKKPFRSMNAHEKSLMDRLAHISSGEDRDFVLLRAAFTANQEQLLPKYFL